MTLRRLLLHRPFAWFVEWIYEDEAGCDHAAHQRLRHPHQGSWTCQHGRHYDND